MTQQSLITRLKAVEEALKESNFWLKWSLLCKEFHWDYDQRLCAEEAAQSSDAALSDLRELIKEAEGQKPIAIIYGAGLYTALGEKP